MELGGSRRAAPASSREERRWELRCQRIHGFVLGLMPGISALRHRLSLRFAC